MDLVSAAYPHPLREDAHGTVRVGATRVALESVIALFDHGASAEEIALRYDALTLGDVYATLSFYMAHRDEVAEYIRGRQRESARARVVAEQNSPFMELRRRLAARKSA
jgi:uncharacterized protein (DUF433 family)